MGVCYCDIVWKLIRDFLLQKRKILNFIKLSEYEFKYVIPRNIDIVTKILFRGQIGNIHRITLKIGDISLDSYYGIWLKIMKEYYTEKETIKENEYLLFWFSRNKKMCYPVGIVEEETSIIMEMTGENKNIIICEYDNFCNPELRYDDYPYGHE